MCLFVKALRANDTYNGLFVNCFTFRRANIRMNLTHRKSGHNYGRTLTDVKDAFKEMKDKSQIVGLEIKEDKPKTKIMTTNTNRRRGHNRIQ